MIRHKRQAFIIAMGGALILMAVWLIGCGPNVYRSFDGPSYQKMCQDKCQEKYKSDLDFVGIAGSCNCK